MKRPILVVLAAGMGSRYGGLKQMDCMGGHGQVIVDYSLYDARQAGFEEVIFVITHDMEEDFLSLVGDRISKGLSVRYAFQELGDLPPGYVVPPGRTKPWGTTQALLAARELIHGPFAVINADDYYGPQAFQSIFDYLSQERGPRDHAMVSYPLGRTMTEHGAVARGVCQLDSQGYLTEICERTAIEKDGDGGRFSPDRGKTWVHLPGDTPVSMNFWGFQSSFLEDAWALMPEMLDKILQEDPLHGEIYLPLIVDRLSSLGGKVKSLSSNDAWFGVTYHEDKPSVMAAFARMTREGLYPEDLWGG